VEMDEVAEEADALSDFLQPGLCNDLHSETEELQAALPSSSGSDQGDEVVFNRPSIIAEEEPPLQKEPLSLSEHDGVGLSASAEDKSKPHVSDEVGPAEETEHKSMTDPVTPRQQRHAGVVRSFSPDNGFGFIICESTWDVFWRDVFLHQNQAQGVPSPGDRLSFTVELNAKGHPQARQVRWASDAEEQEEEEKLEQPPEPHPQTLPPGGATADTQVQVRADVQGRAATDRARLLAQRRLRDRQCLCIEDPMERNRTLGTSFTGQELLSYELLRALSLLKRGSTQLPKELFEEAPVSRRKRGQAEKREYSPVPMQSMSRDGNLHRAASQVCARQVCGKNHREAGTQINHLKVTNSLEDIWIDKQSEDKQVIFKGEPANVANAWARVEEIMAAGYSATPSNVAHARGRGARRGMQQRQRMANPQRATSKAAAPAAIGAAQPKERGTAAASLYPIATKHKSPSLGKVVNCFGPPPALGALVATSTSSSRSQEYSSYYPPPAKHKGVKHKGNKIVKAPPEAETWYQFQ